MPVPSAQRGGLHSRLLTSSGTSTAYWRSASIGHDLQCALVGRGQDDAGGRARLVRLHPPDGDHAPPVARLETGEAVLGARRAQVVAEVLLHLQEVGGHHRAHGVPAQVVGAAPAAPVAVEAGHRLGAAGLQWAAEHVALLGGLGRHGGSSYVVGAGTGWHRASVTVDPSVPEVLWRPTRREHRAHPDRGLRPLGGAAARALVRRAAGLRRALAVVGRAPRPVLGRRRRVVRRAARRPGRRGADPTARCPAPSGSPDAR